MGIKSFDTGAFKHEAARMTQSPASNPASHRNIDKYPGNALENNRSPYSPYSPNSPARTDKMFPLRETSLKKNESYENRLELRPISDELPQKQILDESFMDHN